VVHEGEAGARSRTNSPSVHALPEAREGEGGDTVEVGAEAATWIRRKCWGGASVQAATRAPPARSTMSHERAAMGVEEVDGRAANRYQVRSGGISNSLTRCVYDTQADRLFLGLCLKIIY
jgi:hypothetical protein